MMGEPAQVRLERASVYHILRNLDVDSQADEAAKHIPPRFRALCTRYISPIQKVSNKILTDRIARATRYVHVNLVSPCRTCVQASSRMDSVIDRTLPMIASTSHEGFDAVDATPVRASITSVRAAVFGFLESSRSLIRNLRSFQSQPNISLESFIRLTEHARVMYKSGLGCEGASSRQGRMRRCRELCLIARFLLL